ncbi:peptidyl-prolyl cis-trans isomerase [Shewanella yunxiaonensis]|uniref:Peptidyl-prolyl cis-trans isomerase n=1 Tax=Shewanella yunxiaonensis TaxID=2829809 RepID=A0ABX7YQG5_9GAMM|nr:peptidylprolyl isomerase [Shewanella yunxiaonensis]QUN05013.1 peptidyl-prolyl cis-trans isomerase [Shewanella yunxiaonensis]
MTRWIIVLPLLLCSQLALALDIQKDNLFPRVELDTTMGKIVVDLDRSRAPITVDNFLTYVVRGDYNNTVFHRIIKDFVVQGGGYDPQLKTLREDKPIVNESGNGLSNTLGTIGMAREKDPHTATRQFYFNVADNTKLDPSSKHWGYAVFGEVSEGLEVLQKMAQVPTGPNTALQWEDVPLTPIILKKATLLPAN